MSLSSFLPVREDLVSNFFVPSTWIPKESWVSALFLRHQTHQLLTSQHLLQQFCPFPTAVYTLAPWSSTGKQHVLKWCSLTGETSKPRASPRRSSIPMAKRDGCCVGSKMAKCMAGTLGFVPSKLPTSSGLGNCWICGAGIMENRVTPAGLHACFVASRLTLQLQRLESSFLNNKLNFWPLLWSSGASYNRLCQMPVAV